MLRILASALLSAAWAGAATAEERPTVVELFTSEGCSSCPPADAVLTDLTRQRPDVLPLAFHVTYWDQLGWRDPYGLRAATDRQARYGARFGDGSYTPEMVVDGRTGLVGSDRAAAETAIAAAQAHEAAGPDVSVVSHGASVTVAVGAGRGTAKVVLVGYDPQHRTAVGRGENSGRTLLESNIVRSIRTIGQWSGELVSLSVPAAEGERSVVLLEAADGTILGTSRPDAAS